MNDKLPTICPFSSLELAAPDPIYGLSELFRNDTNQNKVNLGVGVYQNCYGVSPVLESVKLAEQLVLETERSKTYLPVGGDPLFLYYAWKLMAGSMETNSAVSIQTHGGTGALRLGADLLAMATPDAEVWMSSPSWPNHAPIFKAAGLKIRNYPYYDETGHSIDFDAMFAALEALPTASVVLLQSCCHNPTGMDLTREQWSLLAQLFEQKGLIAFLDFAYQGFDAGLEEDAWPVRLFLNSDITTLVAHSLSKTCGLYRERVGALIVKPADVQNLDTVEGQLKKIVRATYSTPSAHGAMVVNQLFSNPVLLAKWKEELAEMRGRLAEIRADFALKLERKCPHYDFSFVRDQKGMFSYLGLAEAQVLELRQLGLYMLLNSRVCIAGLNPYNVEMVTDMIASVCE